ncbi:hypothetical protein MMC28_005338 [Mycoblastus sanguinarius]|nr:hypothetical protein [Mycoblastus sanguinarius]
MGHGQHRNSVGPAGFGFKIKASAKRIASNISPTQQSHEAFDPIDQDYPPSFSTKRSSTSSRSSHRSPPTSSVSQIPDRKPVPSRLSSSRHHPSATTPSHQNLSSQQSLDAIPPQLPTAFPYADLNNSTSSLTMASASFANGFRPDYGKPPSTSQSNVSFGQGGNNASVPTPNLPPAAGGTQNPNIVYQQIHDVSSKRISTLDYLRKAHDGRVYWFNTLLFNKSDLSKMPFFEPKKLARRATNYLLLGLSLPTILDLNASNPQEYLRALNALLSEFESYQQIHPPEGGSASSLSRARIPQIFKRATHAGTKGRRASSAADIGLPMNSSDPADLKAMTTATTASSTASSFPASEQDLLPGEEYTHLLTPSLPFDPDFFETFATLCDVLIDCYTRIMSLIPSPAMCVPGTGETFSKADARLRKVIVAGIIKEFEDASRSGAKAEFAGLGKVVLGGLM